MKQIPVYLMIAAMLTLLLIGCGKGQSPEPTDKVDFSLSVEGLAGDSGDARLELAASESRGGYELLLKVAGEGTLQGASALIGFDSAAVHQAQIERGAALDPGDLFLALENRGDVAPVAFHTLGGASLASGDVVARLRFESGPARGLSISAPAPPPENLSIETGGGFSLSFDEINTGDLNSDGTVSGIDVFPIAAHFLHNSDHNGHTATDPTDNCVDGNMDGVVNGSDVFVIAVNFGHAVDSYNIYMRENEMAPWMLDISADREAPDYPTDCFPSYLTDPTDPSGSYVAYMVRTYDDGTASESEDSEIVDWGVAPTLQTIDVTPADTTVQVDGFRQFTATGHWSDGGQADITGMVTWFCEHDGTLAEFTATAGQLRGIAAGDTSVWCTYDTVESTHAAVEVTSAPVTLEFVIVTPSSAEIDIDGTQQFTATAHWSDDSQTNVTADATWTCEHQGTIAVFGAVPGLLTGVAEGTTSVWATYQTEESNHPSVEVIDGALTLLYVTVTPGSANVEVGATKQFTATARWSDFSETNVTAAATWVSENTDYADFTGAAGLLEGLAVGELDIWCTYQGEESTHAGVTVTTVGTGVVITIEEEEAYSAINSNYQFRAGTADAADVDFDADYWDFTDLGHAGHSFKKYKDMDFWEMDNWRDRFPPIADRFFRQSDPDSGYSHTMEPRFCNTTLSVLEVYGQVLVEVGGEGTVITFDDDGSNHVDIPYPFYEGYVEFLDWDWVIDDFGTYPSSQTIWGVKEGTVKTHMGEYECLLLRQYTVVDLGAITQEELTYQWLGDDGRLLAQTTSQNFNSDTWEYTNTMAMLVEEPYDP